MYKLLFASVITYKGDHESLIGKLPCANIKTNQISTETDACMMKHKRTDTQTPATRVSYEQTHCVGVAWGECH